MLSVTEVDTPISPLHDELAALGGPRWCPRFTGPVGPRDNQLL